MTKKLLYQFDTDTTASVFDSVVAYDGGADQVTGIGNVTHKMYSQWLMGALYEAQKTNSLPLYLLEEVL